MRGQGIIHDVSEYKFYHPVEIRYSDLGTRQHVNNARYLSYLEDARIAYWRHLGLPTHWGVIIVDIHITYHKPIFLEDQIKVGVRVSSVGHKSMTFDHCIVNLAEKTLYASVETVLVAYDYENDQTIPVPEVWREAITAFEAGE